MLVPLLVGCIVILLTLIIGLAAAWYYYHQDVQKRHRFRSGQLDNSDEDNGSLGRLVTFGDVKPTSVEKVIMRGCFGVVWRGVTGDKVVAVKVFPEKDRESWRNECRLYTESYMQHPSILSFWFGEERRSSSPPFNSEFWLVTSFCEMGNLTQFLRHTQILWEELGQMTDSLLCGLAYLHEDISMEKPAVAHRDLKSANILLMPGPRCLLADFGLAIELHRQLNRATMEESGQAGTPRYMAPECLEARINLSDHSSFTQMDVYSMALIMWELSSRCRRLWADDVCPAYALPYQAEVGEHPGIIRMRDLVATKRHRPKIPPLWSNDKGGRLLVRTIVDCWDHHPEARLTAAGVHSRIKKIWSPPKTEGNPLSVCSKAAPQAPEPMQTSLVMNVVNNGMSREGILDESTGRSLTGMDDYDENKQILSDSGIATGGATTDPESSDQHYWYDCPAKTFSRSLLENGRLKAAARNEISSTSTSSEFSPKSRYPHSPRVQFVPQRAGEGSSVWETSGGYDAQKSSSESSSSDAGAPPPSACSKFSKVYVGNAKHSVARAIDRRFFSNVHSESSV